MRLCIFGHCAHIYCITVRCDAALDDLTALTRFALAASLLLAAAAIFSIRCRAQLGMLAGTLLALLCTLHLIRQEREQQFRISEAREVAALHTHRCWDRQRCLRGFSVFVWHNGSSNHKQTPWWTPPPDIATAPSADSACAVVVQRQVSDWQAPSWAAALPGWRDGRNHIFIDQSDQGTSWEVRRAHLGCALVAQSHMELTNYIHDLDISLPLEGSRLPGGEAALDKLHASLASTPATARPYWLTFRGTTYAGSGRTGLLNLSRLSTARQKVVVVEECHKVHQLHEHRAFCASLDRGMKASPPYTVLLNSTFALVPGGRQPASFRLNEVMAAACIPVFVSGDERTSSPYVRPFNTKIDWGSISLHFAFGETAEVIHATLAALPKEKLHHMQEGVRRAWRKFLAPSRVSRTFYELVRERSVGPGGERRM